MNSTLFILIILKSMQEQFSITTQKDNQNEDCFKMEHAQFNNTSNTPPKTSEFFPDYLAYMSVSTQLNKKALIRKIVQNGVKYDQYHFYSRPQLRMINHTPNVQILQFQIGYGSFSTILSLINVDNCSLTHNLSDVRSGNFGSVFKTYIQRQSIAIKCIEFNLQNFIFVFKYAVTQYFLLKIASIIDSGPRLTKSFGFDFVVYRNCIQFSMEACEPISHMKMKDYVEQQLKKSLKKLHELQIIHYDIKEDNICYSYERDLYIFIDFGLSRFVKELLGEKTLTLFRGSMIYCSAQMQKQYLNQRSTFIDVYFNDSECLRKSIEHLRKQNIEEVCVQDIALMDSTHKYELIYLKFCLFRLEKHIEPLQKFIDKVSKRIIQEYCVDILQFVRLLPYSQCLHQFMEEYVPSDYNDEKYMIKMKAFQLKNNHIYQELNPIFQETYHRILNFNEVEMVQFQPNDNLQLERVLLLHPETDLKLKKQLYYLKVANFIRIDHEKTTYEDRFNVAVAFIKFENVIEYDSFLSCPIKKTILHIFRYSLTPPTTTYKVFTIDMLIVSIIFLQIPPQEHLIELFQSILKIDYSHVIRLRLVFKVLTSLKWNQVKYHSKYHYQTLLQSVILIFQKGLKLQRENDDDVEENLIKVLWRVVEQRICKSSLEIIMEILENENYKKIVHMQIDFAKEIAVYVYNRFLQYNAEISRTYHELIVQSLEYLLQDHSKQKYNFTYIHFTLSEVYRINEFSNNFQYIFQSFKNNYEHYEQFDHFKLVISHQIYLYQFQKINTQTLIKGIKNIIYALDKISVLEICEDLLGLHMIKGKKTNIQLLNFIEENVDSIIAFPQKFSLSLPNLHKHNNLFDSSLRILQYLYNFSKNTDGVLAKMQIFQNKALKYLENQQCLLCKIRGLLTVNLLQAFIFRIQKNYDQSLNLYIQSLIFSLKYQQFRQYIFDNILLLINFTQQMNYYSTCKNLVLFLYQTAQCLHYESIYLFERNFIVLKMVYLYVYSHEDRTKVINFIDRLAEELRKKFNRRESEHFYSCLHSIIESFSTQIQKNNFYNKHHDIIEHFCSKSPSKKPYLSLYFIILLQLNTDKQRCFKMFEFIAKSLYFVDFSTKQLILNRYYQRFILFHKMKPKKTLFLLKTHRKKSMHERTKWSQVINTNKSIYRLYKSKRNINITNKLIKHIKKYFNVNPDKNP